MYRRILDNGIRHLPFRSEIFYSAGCCEVFEHISDYPLMINELYQVIKKKGKLLATVPYRMSVHIHSFDEQKIYNDLKNGGYIVKMIYGFGFELEGIGKRLPSKLRVLIHEVFCTLFKRANFLLVIGHKSS